MSSTMASTTKIDFSATGTKVRKSTSRPTSHTRHHNPHSQGFKSTLLPNGSYVNVSTKVDAPPRPLPPREPSDPTPDSEHHAEFKTKKSSNNTKRYGCNSQPWANTTDPAHGVVPVVAPNALHHPDFMTTSRDAFSMASFSPHSSFRSTRRSSMSQMDDSTKQVISTVVKDEALAAVEDWIKSAPGFEGEIVTRMLRDIGPRVSRPSTANARLETPTKKMSN